jgi:hypothetical protein
MSERCGNYLLRAQPMPAWRDDEGYSVLGFVDEPHGRRVGSLMLRGPYPDWEQAREAALAALREMARDLEIEEQEKWFVPY